MADTAGGEVQVRRAGVDSPGDFLDLSAGGEAVAGDGQAGVVAVLARPADLQTEFTSADALARLGQDRGQTGGDDA
ncbi:MAG TPA: hypothetical protein VK694_04510 [Verrucomicrobiae bacterium]|nr:hypothetical protein [Verrucomicrobiae bacterium]